MTADSDWFQFDIECDRKDAEALQTLLFELGASGTEERCREGEAPPPRQPWDTGPMAPLPAACIVRAWFEAPDAAELSARMEAELRLMGVQESKISWTPYQPVDWESQFRQQHQSIEVSPRLTISPPWLASPGDLIIEPGIGFGTGAHPTTLQALRALDQHADDWKTALDVGCGSGILALAAAKLGLQANGFDIEEKAVENAIRHAETNHLTAQFSCQPIQAWTGVYDIVLANLHAELLHKLHAELVRLTAHLLITAGILSEKSDLVLDVLSPHFESYEAHTDGEWVNFTFSGPRSIG